MITKLLLLFLSLFFGITMLAQKTSNVHIVTKKRNLQPYYRFIFELNGQPYKLDDGQCIDTQLTADSIYIQIFDKTIFRKKPVYGLRVAASENVYLFVYMTYEGTFKTGRLVAELICETCYQELKAKCK
jgi:hypothetical protein